jgi:hypothetical protein
MAEKEGKGGGLTGNAVKLGFGGRTRLEALQRQWHRTALSSTSLGVQPSLPMKDTTPHMLLPMVTTGARHVVAGGFRLGEVVGSAEAEGSYARPGWSSSDWWRREANFGQQRDEAAMAERQRRENGGRSLSYNGGLALGVA